LHRVYFGWEIGLIFREMQRIRVIELRVMRNLFVLKRVEVTGSKVKGEATPLQAGTGPEGSRRLRLPDF
jgi:hypothetical protein